MTYSDNTRAAFVAAYKNALRELGYDPNDSSISETPDRVLRALEEMTRGQRVASPGAVLSKRFDASSYNEMIVVKDIDFVSLCEHHLLPFAGKVAVGYIPSDTGVVGLSKIPRLVDVFAQRLQLQERLTTQIVDTLVDAIAPRGAGVYVQASHACMTCRGVLKAGASMVTSALRGCFLVDDVRAEFLRAVDR